VTKHHLLNEEHQRFECIYCHHKLKGTKWDSAFESAHHYKAVKCGSCGKENRLRVDFHGSGHDSWDGTHAWAKDFKSRKDGKVTTLESRIKKCERVDKFKTI
tara:strand:- start:21880 stop:22185 length:306 start_codon:yes stop_codon:yes gene_type:complete